MIRALILIVGITMAKWSLATQECGSSLEDHNAFLERVFAENMRRQSDDTFSLFHFVFCHTSNTSRSDAAIVLQSVNSTLAKKLNGRDIALLRFIKNTKPLIYQKSREALASNLISSYQRLACLVSAFDQRHSLQAGIRCLMLHHFQKLVEAARSAIGPLGTCDPEGLPVDCSGWEDQSEKIVHLLSYFTVQELHKFLQFLEMSCEPKWTTA